MNKVSKSPDRHTFQRDGYVKRAEEKGEPINENYLEYFQKIIEDDKRKFDDPESRKNNMEYDLLTTNWILEKVRTSESYAQNLYAAMCNMQFVRKELFPYLRQDPNKDLWGCSWRYAGGIIADMRQEGDYIDWYCSGIRDIGIYPAYKDDETLTDEQLARMEITQRYVPEGVVTEEIEKDLYELGWIPVPYEDNK